MGNELDIVISDEQIKGMVEEYTISKKIGYKKLLFYILNPSLYPFIIMISVLSIFLLFSTFKNGSNTKANNIKHGINLDSLNKSFSENSLLFNNSILYYTDEVENYIAQPQDSASYYKLRRQGFKLLLIDSLSLEQQSTLTTYLALLDKAKNTFFNEKANKEISAEIFKKYKLLLTNKDCIDKLLDAEAKGLVINLPCGNSSGLLGNGPRMNELMNLKIRTLSEIKALENEYSLDESLLE